MFFNISGDIAMGIPSRDTLYSIRNTLFKKKKNNNNNLNGSFGTITARKLNEFSRHKIEFFLDIWI